MGLPHPGSIRSSATICTTSMILWSVLRHMQIVCVQPSCYSFGKKLWIQSITLRCVALHCIAWHRIALYCITSHHITSHFITCITLHDVHTYKQTCIYFVKQKQHNCSCGWVCLLPSAALARPNGRAHFGASSAWCQAGQDAGTPPAASVATASLDSFPMGFQKRVAPRNS